MTSARMPARFVHVLALGLIGKRAQASSSGRPDTIRLASWRVNSACSCVDSRRTNALLPLRLASPRRPAGRR
jgi:hypothetical protein